MKAVRSSSYVSIVHSLSSFSHVFASLVSDRGNISVFKHIIDSEEFMNVFMRIGFSSTIKLASFEESQVVTFNGKLVCDFRNSDCGTRSLRKIVEEAKVERPLDRSLAFACRYTKHSQELLEYVFGTCPKVFNQQDKKHAHTPRKKQVTFEDQIATSSSNTHKHVEPMHTQKSNVPVPPSTE
ncbi:hypothetical protein Tco_0970220 [Tanacetum coccineum]